MKRKTAPLLFNKKLAAILVASFFFASNPWSKEPKPGQPSNIKQTQSHALGIGVGQTFLLGGFKNHGEDKITADLFYEYAASYSFDLLVNAHFSGHSFLGEKTTISGLTSSIKSRLFEFDAFSPFVLGGLGFYMPQLQRDVGGEVVESNRKATFGVNLGAGADLRLNPRYTVGFITQYHRPFKIKQETQPTVRGSYIKLLITLMRTF